MKRTDTKRGMVAHFSREYSPRDLRLLAPYGVAAPLVYVTALVVGNILDPTYSQVRNTVSELFERGAPNRDLIDSIFLVYGLFLIPFAEGLYKSFNTSARAHPYSLAKAIFVSLFIIAICSLAWNLFFPLDANGGYTSLTGMMHLVLSVPVVFATLLVELSFWRVTRVDSFWAGYSRFSLAIFTVNLLAGLSLIILVNSDYRGLLERISIASFLLWIELISVKLFRILPSSPIEANASKMIVHPFSFSRIDPSSLTR